MFMKLMHMVDLNALHKSYGSMKQSEVIKGHRGENVKFTKSVINHLFYKP